MPRHLQISVTLMLLLTALCLVVFSQGLQHGFTNLDDNLYVSANPELERGLSSSGLRWAFTTRHGNLWMPVTWVSFLADRQFFGPAPTGFHGTNIFLHLANTLLLYIIMRRLTGTIWRAGLIAALFAVHPLHVESVAWVAERKDVLSGFFFLLAIRFYLGYGPRLTVVRYLAALFCFALALMSKPMAVTLPVVLLLIDFWDPETRRPLKRLLLEKIPFLVLAAALAVVTYQIVQTRDMGAPVPIPLLDRLGQAFVYYGLYLGKMFWPANLSVFYPPEGLQYPAWKILPWMVLLITLTVAAWWRRDRWRPVWIGFLWFLVMLLPVLDVVQGGMQLMSDRYFYLPSIGLFVAVAWLAAHASEWRPFLRRAVPVLAIAAVLVLTVAAHRQTRVWQSSQTLFTHALAVNEANYLAHMNLGKTLDDAGRSAEALPHLRRAVALRPDPLHQVNLADALCHVGRQAESIPFFLAALRNQPVFPTAHNNLGIALAGTGDIAGAGEHFQVAVNQDPDYAEAHFNLGLVRLREGRKAEAAASLRRGLELDPRNAAAREQLRRLSAQGY